VLRRLSIRGFKSIRQAGPIELAPLTVLYGPNASGKSNLIDAVQLLSRLASERTIADALSEPIRGRPLEAFTMPEEGLPGLLAQPSSSLELEAEIEAKDQRFRYRVEVAIHPRSGFLNVRDEFLAQAIIACPDPHIERWFLADPESLAQTFGLRYDVARLRQSGERPPEPGAR